MNRPGALWIAGTFLVVQLLCIHDPLRGQQAFNNPPTQLEPGGQAAATTAEPARADRLSIDVARQRAKLMHAIYAATLDVMHDRYFHGQRAIVPARAMEDVFAELKRQSQIEARWISVNLKAMSIDHEPESDFEKRAAAAIAAGKPALETFEAGFYRRAGAIPMSVGCIGCHEGFAQKSSPAAKFTALVISIPLDRQRDQQRDQQE